MKCDGEATDRYTYAYNANGQVAHVKDNALNRVTQSEYDLSNRPLRIKTHENGGHVYTGEAMYDVFGNLGKYTERVGTGYSTYETTFGYDEANRPTTLSYGDTSNKVTQVYDAIGRMSEKTVTVGGKAYPIKYEYEAGGYGNGSTTPLVKSITQNGKVLAYTYDEAGNIESVGTHDEGWYTRNGNIPPEGIHMPKLHAETGAQMYAENDAGTGMDINRPLYIYSYPEDEPAEQGRTKVTYGYDKLGQLTRVNDPNDDTFGFVGTTWVYAYDLGGNILKKTAYRYTTGTPGTAVKTISYAYEDVNWKDKLTRYDGKAITYDAIGNPLSDGTWTYTWTKGRQLASMSKLGTGGVDGNGGASGTSAMTVSYHYNADGLRIKKTVNGIITAYTLHGKQIMHMTQGGNTMHFYYDTQGRPAIVNFNGTRYAYMHNLQGDIIGIVDQNGNTVVEYRYDAWGKAISKTGSLASTLGTVNPFRYRGYVYDEETGLYATATRYYNPERGRFLNADTLLGKVGVALSHNMFVYCNNNPCRYKDLSGMIAIPYNQYLRLSNEISKAFDASDFVNTYKSTPFFKETVMRVQYDKKIPLLKNILSPSTANPKEALGVFYKSSIYNTSGKFGVTDGSSGIYYKGVNDFGTTTAQAGIFTEGGLGVSAKVKASAYTGRSSITFDFPGWTVEVAGNVDIGALGVGVSWGYVNGAYEYGVDFAAIIGVGWQIRVQPK